MDLPETGLPLVGLGAAAGTAEVDAPESGAAAGASPPPHAPSHFSSCCGSPPSPIRRLFSSIFGMCRDIQTQQQKEREARRKDTRTLKQIASRLELDPPRSPLSDEAASEQETEEQQQARYDREYAEFLQRQQQQAPEHPDTLPLQARVPTHSQPRPSTTDDLALDWWSDLTGGGGYYGSGGYDPSGAGGSRPTSVPCSEDEDATADDDDE